MEHNCDKEKVLDIILDEIKEIKGDLKDLLAFKWQVIGISIAVSAIMNLGSAIVEAAFR